MAAKVPTWMARRLPSPPNKFVAILKQARDTGETLIEESPPLGIVALRKWLQKRDDPKLKLISISYIPVEGTENGFNQQD